MKYPEDFINKIICGDCLEVMKDIPDNSIDLVVTDPPYGINKEGITNDENLNEYYNSLSNCFRVLKNDTFFVTFASIGNLPQFFVNNPFDYRWQFILYINNGMVRGSLGFNRYISILIFQRGKAKLKKPLLDIMEVSTSSQQCAKRQHPTQKRGDVCKKLITSFSNEGDLILDPFLGSGTTAEVCKKLNRRFIGIEINPEYCKIAEERLKKVPKRLDKFVELGILSQRRKSNNFTVKLKKVKLRK